MSQDNTNQLKQSLVIDGVLLLIFLVATSYLFYFLSTARPHVGMWQELLIIIPLFGTVRYGFFTIYTFAYIKQPEHKLIISVASFVAAFIISSIFSSLSSSLSVDRLTQAYQPMITALHAKQVSPCNKSNDELDIADTIRPKVGNRGIKGAVYWANVYFSGDRFVIAISGGSIDIDGSTLYYESKEKKWTQFHNDIYNDRSIFQEFIKNSSVCRVRELQS